MNIYNFTKSIAGWMNLPFLLCQRLANLIPAGLCGCQAVITIPYCKKERIDPFRIHEGIYSLINLIQH